MSVSTPESSIGSPTVDELARLIGRAGARTAPSAALTDSVRVAVEQEWRTTIIRRKVTRAWRLGLAASVGALGLGLGWVSWHRAAQFPALIVGTMVDTRGSVQVTPRLGRDLISAGDTLAAGARIETGPGGAVLLTIGAVGVRVGQDSVLGLERPGQLHLVRGQLYVDSGETPRSGSFSLVVVTEFGSLVHLGTQYQIQVRPGKSMDTSVREGRVRLESFGQARIIERGESLHIAEDKTVTRIVVPPDDARWLWVSEFVPAFSIEGRSFTEFLDWFARETGRTLTFTLPATRADTDRTTLNGSISGLTPVQALNAVAATTRFHCDLSIPGQIRVSAREKGGVSMRKDATPIVTVTVPAH